VHKYPPIIDLFIKKNIYVPEQSEGIINKIKRPDIIWPIKSYEKTEGIIILIYT
jgi:hypothetical protein